MVLFTNTGGEVWIGFRFGLASGLGWRGSGEVVIRLAGRWLGLWVRDWDSVGVRVWELPVSFRASYFASVSGYKLIMHSTNLSISVQTNSRSL